MSDSTAIAHGAAEAAHHEHPPYQRHHFETIGAAERRHELRHVAVPADGNHVLRRAVYRLPDLPQLVLPGLRGGVAPVADRLGHRQHRGADHFELHHGHGRVVRGDAQEGRAGAVPGAHLPSGPRLPRHQDHRVLGEVGEAPRSRLPLQHAVVSSIRHRIPKSTRNITTSRCRSTWRGTPSFTSSSTSP